MITMNGVDVLKLLSRMAADTSSSATWLEQPHIILILSRDEFSQLNEHLTPILAVVFVLLSIMWSYNKGVVGGRTPRLRAKNLCL